ncbi:MAG: metallophosphoesterase family protein, partial [Clostridiales bacterium]|nr:metallophosphoesterase family protein [Clostridiales bacterium]
MKKLVFPLLLAAMMLFSVFALNMAAAAAVAFEEAAAFIPETLTLTPGANERAMNFNWYSDRADNAASTVRIAEKSAITEGDFPAGAIVVEGIVGDASAGKSWHKAGVSGLKPDTEYVYSVSNDKNNYSEIYEFKTAQVNSFRFAVTGDPQLTVGLQDNTSRRGSETTAKGWQDTMAAIAARGVDFIAGVGDQVDITANGSEAEYANFFAPGALRNLPYAPAIGNHDRHYLFNYHYNLPNEQVYAPLMGAEYGNAGNQQYADMEAAGNYWYRYNNALFVVLNDSGYPANAVAAGNILARFEATLRSAIAASPDHTWMFVQHHKSTASVADHIADTDIQYYVEAGFERLMEEYGVDFVLAGHDHVYARSYPLKNGVPDKTGVSGAFNATLTSGGDGAASARDPRGVLYFTTTTGSGLKYYELFNNAGNLYVKNNTAYPYLVEGLFGSAAYAGANIINNNLTVPNGTTDAAQYSHEVGKLPLSTAKYLQNKTPGYLYIEVSGNSVSFKFYDLDDYKDIPYDSYTVTKTEETIPETNVSAKTLNANIVGGPTVITYLDNMNKLDNILADGITTSVMVDYTTLANAKKLLKDVADKALPIFVLNSVSDAQDLAVLIAKGYEDTHVASADPAVLRAYRDIATKSRASLIIDRDINPGDVREIIAAANSCRALNVMVYAGKADKKTIEEIQKRFTTVWMFSDDTTVGNHEAITAGV